VEFKRVDTYTNNKTTAINIPERISRTVGGLNIFLEKLQENKPEIYENYVGELESKLLSLVSENSQLDLDEIHIPKLNEFILNLTGLQKLYFTYSYQLLNIPHLHSSETIETTWYNNDKSSLFPSFYRLQVLCNLMGREEAISYYKGYVDKVIYERTEPDLDQEDLDSDWNAKEEAHPSYGTGFRVNRGKYGFRVDKCVNFDVLKEVNDPELTDVLACYGDTASFESMNPNFVFTMTKTLMKGDPYCDKCFHDKRHVNKIEHPPEEFWLNLDPKLNK
jgi:hypothetical protein